MEYDGRDAHIEYIDNDGGPVASGAWIIRDKRFHSLENSCLSIYVNAYIIPRIPAPRNLSQDRGEKKKYKISFFTNLQTFLHKYFANVNKPNLAEWKHEY